MWALGIGALIVGMLSFFGLGGVLIRKHSGHNSADHHLDLRIEGADRYLETVKDASQEDMARRHARLFRRHRLS